MGKNIIFIISLLLFRLNGISQEMDALPKIKWMSIQEAEELNNQIPKKILIDMYTDWCGWCKKMDAETFSHPAIVNYVNAYFYAVKFDAEYLDTINFNGKDYSNVGATAYRESIANGVKARKPSHSLAQELLKGSMSYPTIVYLDENLTVLSPVPGYKTAQQIEPILMYFGESVYKNAQWETFDKYFNKSFLDTVIPDTTLVKWYSLNEALELNKMNPRKIFIDMFVSWSGLNKMAFRTTYNHPIVARYLNENYYPVRFDALSKDSVNVFNTTLINEGKTHPYHQFAVQALQGKMKFPQILFMDENNLLLTAIPDYLPPENLEPILSFFIGDSFRSTKYEEFVKSFTSEFK